MKHLLGFLAILLTVLLVLLLVRDDPPNWSSRRLTRLVDLPNPLLPNGLAMNTTGRKFDPAWAVVRIHSHGASGTVIWSTQGKSYILSCAHMFDSPASRKKKLNIDGPLQPRAPRRIVQPKVLAVDFQRDLSLIELPNGPFWTVPVAPQGHRPATKLLSIGYDNMQWPMTRRSATFLNTGGNTTYTRERPWHGRSGGALIDPKANYVVGVVQGYELVGPRRGLYVSHVAILRFLQKYPNLVPRPLPVPPPVPYANRYFQPGPSLRCFPGGT